MFEIFKKNKSEAEQEREWKKKADQDRARTQKIKEDLEIIQTMPYRADLSMDDIRVFDEYTRQAIKLADELEPVRFPVDQIDQKIGGIVEVLKTSKADGGSKNTLSRCFTGIAYGLSHGHKEIPSHAIEADVIERRVDMLSRYMTLVLQSREIDKYNLEIAKKNAERNKRVEDLEKAEDELDALRENDPGAFEEVVAMVPNERSVLEGVHKTIAAALKAVTDREVEINQNELLIGQMKQYVETLETAVNAMVIQLRTWEPNIDQATILEIQRLTKDFEKDQLKQQQYMDKLDETAAEVDLAINRLFAGLGQKEKMVEIVDRYERMKRRREQRAAADEAGRLKYEAEKAAQQQNETGKQVLTN